MRGDHAELTKRGIARRRAAGRAYASTPFGFDRVGEKLFLNVEEMEYAQAMRTLRDAGWTYRRIVDYLNEEHVATKRGGDWFPSTVRYIIQNPLYADPRLEACV